MRAILVPIVIFLGFGDCKLWPKGVVHYSINAKDYDLHSQDEILATLVQLQLEICVKFFATPANYSASRNDKILYITNPDKRKNCVPQRFDYSGSVVDMVIGYKCLNRRDIARVVVDMLKASVEQNVTQINSYDLLQRFQQREEDQNRQTLLTPPDRNFINANYHSECRNLVWRPSRRAGEDPAQLTEDNNRYYQDKLWPLGVVMYSVEDKLQNSADHMLLKYAMTGVELASCAVFQEVPRSDGVLAARNQLWFADGGADEPQIGFREGVQTIKLSSMVHGSAGHTAHALNNLMRALGLPMMSNRWDRDNYVLVHWKNVAKGKEHLLEKTPEAAWLQSIPYDFDSATHAPANYMSGAVQLGAQTVQPIQDQLWQRTLSMGRGAAPSVADTAALRLLYGAECERRAASS